MADKNQECSNAIITDEYFEYIIEYKKNLEEEIKKYNPKCVQIINDKYAIFHLSHELELFKEIALTGVPVPYGPYGKSSMESSGILVFHTQPYVPLRGEGVLIGILDSGIDYTHSVFTYEDNTTKIANIWDQTIGGNPPEGFDYGTEYTMEDINRALQSKEPYAIVPSKDITGHGTFLAGIAAGREIKEEDFVGAAPDAEILIVKLKEAKEYHKSLWLIQKDQVVYQSTDIMMGVKYLTLKAKSIGKPLAIIIGLGNNIGPHDGTTTIEDYLNSVLTRGNVINVAGGNEANLGHHYRGEFREDEAYKNVEINVAKDELPGFTIGIWTNAPDKISVALTSPTGEYIARIPSGISGVEDIELILEKTKIRIVNTISEPRTGDQAIGIAFQNPTEGIWTITVFGDLIVNGRFDMWIPREGWIKEDTQFLQPDPYTTVTTPGTSINLLTSGGYNHKMGNLYINSGRGLTRDDELKPDLVAPSVKVYGPLPGNKFGTMTGTSVSTAITGGASALLLEWGIVLGKDIEMDTRKATNYLKRGARRKKDIEYPNSEWGFGELNLFGTYEVVRGRKT